MTTRLRFTLLLGTLLGAFLVTALALHQIVSAERTRSLEIDRQTKARQLSFWVDTASRDLPRIAAEWSESEAIAKALEEIERGKDPAGIRSALVQANVAAVWSVRPNGTLAFVVTAEREARIYNPPIEAKELGRVLSDTPNARFFSNSGTELYEFSARRLQFGSSRNWMVFARHWTTEHLRTLSALAEAKAELRSPESIALEEQVRGRIVLLRPLQDWQGKTIRVLRVEHDSSELESMFRSNWSQIILYTAFGLTVLAATTLALNAWVLRPLGLIQDSLASENGTILQGLASHRNEFGRVAKLIISAFDQQHALRSEIEKRKRLQASLSASEAALKQSLDDRARLGRDLHDGVIQSLYAAGMGLAGVNAQLRPDQTEAASQLELARGTLNETIRDVRNFIVGLEPEASKDQRFSQAVESLLKSMRGLGRFDSTVAIDDTFAARLNLAQRAHALQITKEAVSNALRHGNADHVRITLQSHSTGVLFEISDNGCGFDATLAEPHGKGLANFVQRARELGAELRVISKPGQGTRIEITFPLP